MTDIVPEVSIIIPSYNDGSYLRDAIQSILEQNYKNVEIIVVDDGSDDETTKKVLNEINIPPVKVYHKAHEGVSAARNFAIEKAAGTYILPLDADNLLGASFLKQAVEILNKYPKVKIVCGDMEMFGKRKGIKKLPEFSMEMLLGQNTMDVTSLFRKSDFIKTKGFNVNMKESFEDWDLWLSMLETGGDVYKLNTVAVHYRVRKNSRNFSLTTKQLNRLRRQIYENHKQLYSQYFFDPAKSFEYDLLVNSREYKLGTKLLKPLRYLYKKLH